MIAVITRRLIAISLLLVGILSSGIGQELFRDGFILKTPFDTVYGKVKYYSYNQAAIQCVFRSDQTLQEKTYQPGEIFGYGIENNLLFTSKKISDSESFFLEVVYQGTVILYAYRDHFRKNYFYLENTQTGDFEALTQKVIRRRQKRSVFKTYIDVLKIMLDKSRLIEDRIENTSLTHKSLTALLMEYDRRYAAFEGRVFNGSNKRWPPKFGVHIVQGYADQKLNGYAGTGRSYLFGAAMKFQKEISRGTNRLFLDLDLGSTYESFDQTYTRSQEVTDQSIITNGLNFLISSGSTNIRGQVDHITTVSMERINLTMPINIKYVFPGSKWLFTINGGLNPQYSIVKSGQVKGILKQGEDIILRITSQEETQRFRYGVNVGFGLMLKGKNNIYLDFQHSPTWFNQGVLKYKYSFVRLGMILNRKAT